MFIPLRDRLPWVRFPAVTALLIAANVLVYLAGLIGGRHDVWVYEWGSVPCEVLGHCANQGAVAAHAPALTLVTAMFVHGGLLHLAVNMLFLWVFGNNVEDAMHPLGFLAFYLLAGISAGIGQSLFAAHSVVPVVGASGAIAAVIGGYLLLYPRAKILTIVFFPIILWTPAWLVAGAWGAVQFLATWQSAFSDRTLDGGVAYAAHLTGFLVGIFATLLLADRVNPAYQELYGAEARARAREGAGASE